MIVLGDWPPHTCAYIAGLLDGEGYIGIKRRRPSKANRMVSFRYCAAVSVAMTDREPVQLIADFCGSGHLIRVRTRGKNKTIYEFMVEYGRAAELLRAALPFLIAKKRQALLVIELCELQKTERNHRTKVSQVLRYKAGVNAGSQYRVLMHSDEYISRLDVIYQSTLKGAARSGNGARFG